MFERYFVNYYTYGSILPYHITIDSFSVCILLSLIYFRLQMCTQNGNIFLLVTSYTYQVLMFTTPLKVLHGATVRSNVTHQHFVRYFFYL